MKRRPHWDDELIFAVMSAAGDGGHLFIDDIHAVIAAVEDWQDANGFSRAGTLMHRLIDAEAAIQRVRDVPKKVAVARRGDVDNPQKLAWYQGWNEAIDAVFRALDGGDAEPELDISISSYAKEADDGEAMWNDGGDA